MLKRFTLNRLWIGTIAFAILCVGGSFLYMQDARKEAERAKAEIQAREQARTERLKQQAETAAAAAAQKADTAHDDDVQRALMHGIVAAPPDTDRYSRALTAENEASPLTADEIKNFYRQLGKEIAEMSPEDLDGKGLDLSQYSERQLSHLALRGINMDLLPQNAQDILDARRWRKKGVEPPPPGYTYLQDDDGTYVLAKEGLIIDVDIDAHGNITGGGSFSGEANGRTIDEITEEIIKKVGERVAAEKAKATPKR